MLSLRSVPSEVSDSILNSVLWFTHVQEANALAIMMARNLKLTSLPMCGFVAQLVEHRTGIAEVTGSNPVEALIFFSLLLSSCLNWKINCHDHSSLSSTTAVHIRIISCIHHIINITSYTNLHFSY